MFHALVVSPERYLPPECWQDRDKERETVRDRETDRQRDRRVKERRLTD
jgi:hypothetical protein